MKNILYSNAKGLSDLFYLPGFPLYFLSIEAKKRDLDMNQALKQAGLENITEGSLPFRISLKKFITLTEYLTKASGDPAFYFSSFFNKIAPEKYDILAMLTLNMPSLLSSLKMGALTVNYGCNYLFYDLNHADDEMHVSLYPIAPDDITAKTGGQVLLLNTVSILQFFAPDAGQILKLEFSCNPVPYKDKLENFYHCPVYFNRPVTSMHFKAPPDRKNPNSVSPNTMKFLFKKGNQEWTKLSHSGIQGRVKLAIHGILRESIPDLESIAHALSKHPRLLQKDLQNEGTSFREILGQIRIKRAAHLIYKSSLSFEDIAERTGFESAAAFNGFFKRITGRSPGELRALAENFRNSSRKC